MTNIDWDTFAPKFSMNFHKVGSDYIAVPSDDKSLEASFIMTEAMNNRRPRHINKKLWKEKIGQLGELITEAKRMADENY